MKAREIAGLIGGELRGDGDVEITSVAEIDTAAFGEIAFFDKIGKIPRTDASCVIVPPESETLATNVVLHPGVVIGADGFGYVQDESRRHAKFPQIGSVVIENDVEIGANTCIDRGALKDTRIGEGTKIDNLCQIAHNVQIGKRCVIAAMCGISGSSVLEDDVVLAGQVGIADHVVLKSGVTIGAKSAVFPNKVVRAGFWAGIPIRPIEDYKRQTALLSGLERLSQRVRQLSDKVNNKLS